MRYLYSLFLLLLSVAASAQDKAKYDKIYLSDGREIEAKITKVSANSIEFQYPNETVQNVEDAANIRTIVFSSGRVQQFNTNSAKKANEDSNTGKSGASPIYLPIQQNMMAILPVAFFDKISGQLMEDKSKLAQSRIYDFFEDDMRKITPLKMQDTRTTNANLRKSGIGYSDLDETPIEELQKILGVEYLILSKVSVEEKSNVTSNQSTWGGTEKKGNKETGAVHTSSSVNEDKTYNYNVVLEIYKGSMKIYTETRKPFLNMEDSWKDAMEYMLKRTPIYHK